MSYNIKNFAQTVTYTVNDSTANTNAVSLTLLGKSLPNYGTYFNQNFVWLMENFSSDSANPPPYPVQGQLWWDSSYKFLNVYNGTTWNTVYGNLAAINVNGAVTASSLTATNISGTITTNAQPYITSVGNITSSGTISANQVQAGTLGNSGALLTGWLTTAAQPNVTSLGTLTSLTSSGTISAASLNAGTIGNSGATFSGASGTLTGSLNANAYTANSMYAGTIGNTGATFRGASGTITGTFNANAVTANAVYAGTIGNTSAAITGASGSFTAGISGNTFTGGAVYAGTIGNTGAILTGTLSTPAQTNITSLGTLTGLTMSGAIVPSSNASVNLGGSSSQYWNNVYAVNFQGTSTTAKYADLAEKYTLDQDYPIGTVVMIGGDAEATQHDGRSVRALGSVSANPAYKMNDGLENGTYIALKGRVPVRVIGPVSKGQSLRGGPSGLAIAEEYSSSYTFAIAMETVSDIVETTIEAVIL